MAVANRYARALADVVGKTAKYRETLDELERFAAAYASSAELRAVLETPAVTLEQKMKVLEAVAARLKLSVVALNFLRVLAKNYRMRLIEEVREAFRAIAYDKMGVVQVKLATATALGEPERRALRARFEQVTRRQVELEFRLDPALVGGVLAQIRSTVYDGSLRGHLERLRDRLAAG